MAQQVGSEGQIIIEPWIRDELGIQPGWPVVQTLVGDHIEIRFIPPESRRSGAGSLAAHTDVRIPDEDEFRAARERAWELAAEEWRERHDDSRTE
jgi:bifunctional DNA-binding transcriptional regulator/antitoxin component of YhaV-PrlF toxin-antitoxin module